jgi:hypothetical protein
VFPKTNSIPSAHNVDARFTYPADSSDSQISKSLPRATMGFRMQTDHILGLLISERDKLSRAIEALQGTSRGGRPRKDTTPVTDPTPTPNHAPKRRVWTQAMRLAAKRRAKAVWAKKRKAEAKKG